MALPAEHPPLLDLDRLAEIEQGLRLQLGADPDCGVQEVGLVEDLADRLRLVGRGDRLDLDAVLAEQRHRAPQVLLAIADLGSLLDSRPSLQLAERHFSDFPGAVEEGTLPAEWLEAVTEKALP